MTQRRKGKQAPHLKKAPPKAKFRHMKDVMALKEYIRECGEKAVEARRETMANIIRVSQQIADRLTRVEYLAWWQTTPDDNAGFLAAAKRKLTDLELAAVMDDPSASAIDQSDAIDEWMTENWDAIPEVEL